MKEGASAIEICGLTKHYGDVLAVDQIDLTVERGRLFAFLGVNGAGKSTTINIICTLLKKDAGKVVVAGYDVDREPERVRERLGVVFQGSVLDNALTVRENLSLRAGFYAPTRAEAKRRTERVARLLSLHEIARRPYGKLSGGQRRRTDIARALLGNPEILILDEPTTGLDPQTRRVVWDTLEELRREDGMTIFLTTHYMEEADRADDVVIIDAGRIAAQGTPAELKNRFSGDYLYVYAPRSETSDRLFGDLGGAYDAGKYVIKVTSPAEMKRILREFDEHIPDFEAVKGDMDDVFLNVTGKKLSGGEYVSGPDM